jgi:DNA-directed RNA polymerase subunit K/omega
VAEFTPPQVPMNPDKAPKALSIALQEIAEEKVGYERTSEATK